MLLFNTILIVLLFNTINSVTIQSSFVLKEQLMDENNDELINSTRYVCEQLKKGAEQTEPFFACCASSLSCIVVSITTDCVFAPTIMLLDGVNPLITGSTNLGTKYLGISVGHLFQF